MRSEHLFLLLSLLTPQTVFAQPASTASEFEVASVRLGQPGGPHGIWTDGSRDRIRILGLNLKELIAEANEIKTYQVSGPAWIDTERYDVLAKIPSDVAALPSKERWMRIRAMERTLLADRFKASLHRETKDFPVYELVVAKKGPKIRELGPSTGDNVVAEIGKGHLSAKKMSMAQFVDILNHRVDRPVINLTGIDGVFDITLDWAPEQKNGDPLRAARQKENGNEPDSSTELLDGKPPLMIAIQEQLGLRLDLRKAPLEVLVVDHAERLPTEN
jgi:uncharacterized protein (TIGR03435 family)